MSVKQTSVEQSRAATHLSDERPLVPEAEHLEGFLETLRARGRAAKTIASYQSDHAGFERWCQAQGDVLSASALSGAQVKAYRDQIVKDGLRPATVNRKLVFIKRYAGWALSCGLLSAAQHERVVAVRAVRQQRRKPRALSDLELRRFLREVDLRGRVRDQAIVYTLLSTGLRVSELVALSWRTLDISARRAHLTLDDGTARRLLLTAGARRKLAAYIEHRGDAAGLLFQGERGPLQANAVQRIVRKYCRFAKVEVSPGILRHTFAVRFLERFDDLVALANTLGHECLETTRLYLPTEAETAQTQPTGHGYPRPRAVRGGQG